ncbi:hypothetical protein [Luteolibacter marinus]|uniref:hypothetical protein n=1 Tax=Luteolibacter marinus TaxID=2776705 RepID=UPI0018688046|nr:hypothetical protein [Luteolibacter marinus]
MKVERGQLGMIPDHRDDGVGRVLGIIACACVAAWWLNCALAILAAILSKNGTSLWSSISLPMLFVALLGSHFLAVISKSFLRSSDPWGPRAVIAFWASVLVWVPVGWLLALIGGLFRG